MSVRLHTMIATTIAALAVTAATASYASAGPSKSTRVQIPASLANFREPGSTGYVPNTTRVAIPSWLKNFHEPGSEGFVPAGDMTVTSAVGGGLDWVSALIGAGAALGVALAGTGAFMTVRKRRTLAHM
jgi:hypothetical protein